MSSEEIQLLWAQGKETNRRWLRYLTASQYLGICFVGHRGHEDFQSQSVLCVGRDARSEKSKLRQVCSISTYRIPTWTTPLVGLIFVTALVPNTSFLGHVCSVATGYICEFNIFHRLRIIEADSNHRRLGILENSGTARESSSLDRKKVESSGPAPSLCIDRSENVWPIRCAAYNICSLYARSWRRVCADGLLR